MQDNCKSSLICPLANIFHVFFSYEAWLSWNNEFGTMLDYMGCQYYYNIEICDFDPAEDNYEDFCNWESTRSDKQ